jgi:peptide-methionine (S)-S-oxide reductase
MEKSPRLAVLLVWLLIPLFPAAPARAEVAVFAGGCFWCVEADMDKLAGVTSTVSGYAGGTAPNPTYRRHEGYVEAVQVEFDPKVIGYDELVSRFLRTIDVTDAGGQFCDRGASYRSAIFATTDAQLKAARQSLEAARSTLGTDIATPVQRHTTFVAAEDYHQDYYLGKNRVLTRFGLLRQAEAYKRYRKACGRDDRVKEVWGAEAYTAGRPGS